MNDEQRKLLYTFIVVFLGSLFGNMVGSLWSADVQHRQTKQEILTILQEVNRTIHR